MKTRLRPQLRMRKMIRGMSKTFLVLLILLSSIRLAHAIAIPPAAIDEHAVTPSCISVRPAYLFGQGQVYGTDGKGPAIRIENGCDTSVTIETVSTNTTSANELVPVNFIDAGFFADKKLLTKPDEFIFTPRTADCATARFMQDTDNKLKAKRAEALKQKIDNSSSADELLEHVGKTPQEKPDTRPVTCGPLELKPGALLALAMPWGTAYTITGTPDVKIAGQMINPLDVNSPDTFQFAENGDKVTRYMLAVHNIETGQNLKTALRWLQEAAAQGYRPAIFQLEQCYETGKCGVDKDKKEALFWHALGHGDIEPDGDLYKRLDAWQKTHPEVTDY